MHTADPAGGVAGPKGPVPRAAASLPKCAHIPNAPWGRPKPATRVWAKTCRCAIHRGLAWLCLGVVVLRCYYVSGNATVTLHSPNYRVPTLTCPVPSRSDVVIKASHHAVGGMER